MSDTIYPIFEIGDKVIISSDLDRIKEGYETLPDLGLDDYEEYYYDDRCDPYNGRIWDGSNNYSILAGTTGVILSRKEIAEITDRFEYQVKIDDVQKYTTIKVSPSMSRNMIFFDCELNGIPKPRMTPLKNLEFKEAKDVI